MSNYYKSIIKFYGLNPENCKIICKDQESLIINVNGKKVYLRR